MMAASHLPEDILVSHILIRLPIKSLIRFTSVSKRWCFIIISDPQFADSHFKHNSLRRRRLLLYSSPSLIESLDLDTTTPFPPTQNHTSPLNKFQADSIKLLGSCNGLVFVCTDPSLSSSSLFIWNPTTGFLHCLPDPCFSSVKNTVLYGGFGYVSATDDYKVVVAATNVSDYGDDDVVEVKVLSWKTGVWNKIQQAPFLSYTLYPAGVELRENLHWFRNDRWLGSAVVAFDLATEEFREMAAPPSLGDRRCYDAVYVQCVATWGGCLYVFCYKSGACDCIELWVMSEYGVSETWSEVFGLNIVNEPKAVFLRPFLAAGASSVVAKVSRNSTMDMIRIEHEAEQLPVVDVLLKRWSEPAMIVYEESLRWLPDCGAVEEDHKVIESPYTMLGVLLWIADHVVEIMSTLFWLWLLFLFLSSTSSVLVSLLYL